MKDDEEEDESRAEKQKVDMVNNICKTNLEVKTEKFTLKMIWKSDTSLVGKSIYCKIEVIFHFLFQIF